MPILYLLEGGVVAVVARESVGIHQTTEGISALDSKENSATHLKNHLVKSSTLFRVRHDRCDRTKRAWSSLAKKTHQIGSARVQFTAIVVRLYINIHLIQDNCDKDIGGCLKELYARKRSSGHDATAMSALGAVRNGLGFSVCDGAIWSSRTPQAEVYTGIVDDITCRSRQPMEAGTTHNASKQKSMMNARQKRGKVSLVAADLFLRLLIVSLLLASHNTRNSHAMG